MATIATHNGERVSLTKYQKILLSEMAKPSTNIEDPEEVLG